MLTQQMLIGIIAGVVIIVVIACFVLIKKDTYVYDPLLTEVEQPAVNKDVYNFFKESGLDTDHRVNDQRYALAIQNCDMAHRARTPEACHQADAVLLGMRRFTEGTL